MPVIAQARTGDDANAIETSDDMFTFYRLPGSRLVQTHLLGAGSSSLLLRWRQRKGHY